MASLNLAHRIEIWDYQYEGVCYEIHVDAIEQRFIKDVYTDRGTDIRGIDPDVLAHLEQVIAGIE